MPTSAAVPTRIRFAQCPVPALPVLLLGPNNELVAALMAVPKKWSSAPTVSEL